MIRLKPPGPDPKPDKKRKITYKCSDGTRVTQDQIDRMLTAARKIMRNNATSSKCKAYPDLEANDFDHTISQSRCKELGKTELIWNPDNMEFSSRIAHMEWERYRSGVFEEHQNVVRRMLFVKKHDPEGFEKRYQQLSNYRIMKAVK